jgi:hypothetical protein
VSSGLASARDAKTILLTTYKRDGTAVGTPVSIAFDGDRAFFRSYSKAWKTRRLRNRRTGAGAAPPRAAGDPGPCGSPHHALPDHALRERSIAALRRAVNSLDGIGQGSSRPRALHSAMGLSGDRRHAAALKRRATDRVRGHLVPGNRSSARHTG